MLGKKSSDIEPGIVWMPYILAETVSSINSGDLNPKLSIKSRYAVKNVNPNFFGYIRTTSLIRKMKIKKIFKIKNPTD